MALRLINSTADRHVATKTVEKVAEARLPTETGEFRIIGFRSLVSTEEFVALVKGELRDGDTASIDLKNGSLTLVPTVASRVNPLRNERAL